MTARLSPRLAQDNQDHRALGPFVKSLFGIIAADRFFHRL